VVTHDAFLLRASFLVPHCTYASVVVVGGAGGWPITIMPLRETNETTILEGVPQYVRWICSGEKPAARSSSWIAFSGIAGLRVVCE